MNIDTSVRDYYQAQQLDPARLDALLALAGNMSSARRSQRRTGGRLPFALAALAASLFAAMTLLITLQHGTSMDINERAAHEIAMNHQKNLEVEYAGGDLEKISSEMTKLGFTLRRPAQIDLAGMTLIGARYCSIQGQIAALLKYKDQNNKRVTLYQTQASPRLGNMAFDNRVSDDIRIKIWREGNLVYGVAE